MYAEINMINVKNGDAIILTLEKKDRKALILIDGGYKNHYQKLKTRLNQLLPSYNNKIELIICTHYDNDHIGGISEVIKDFHNNIQEIWIHKVSDKLDEQISLLNEKIDEIGSKYSVLTKYKEYVKNKNQQLIIEGYKELKDLLEQMIKFGLEDKIKEPKRGDSLSGFHEFKVISPKPYFYNQYIQKLKDEISNKKLLDDNNEKNVYQTKISDSCNKLEISSVKNGVTPTNLVSIVTLLKIDNKKFLFTGDSGIESYEEQKILNDDLKDLFWLDLPHHGSKNNTSHKMLSHFNPKTVFVSGSGSKTRPSFLLEQCILKNNQTKIYITNSDTNTWYLKFDSNGNYSKETL